MATNRDERIIIEELAPKSSSGFWPSRRRVLFENKTRVSFWLENGEHNPSRICLAGISVGDAVYRKNPGIRAPLFIRGRASKTHWTLEELNGCRFAVLREIEEGTPRMNVTLLRLRSVSVDPEDPQRVSIVFARTSKKGWFAKNYS